MLLFIVCLFLLSSCTRTEIVINEDIPENTMTAKELVTVADSYIKKHYKKEKYYIGKIIMKLDQSFKGKIVLTYSTLTKSPHIIEVSLDTTIKKILTTRYVGKDSKIDPGFININKWKIDIDEAINLGLKFFEIYPDFKYDSVLVKTSNYFRGDMEVWDIEFHNIEKNMKYECSINPYDGNILYNKKIYF